MKVNIKKISEMTGFSTATVSNALNNKRGVSKETAQRIFQAAVETGYLSASRIDHIKLVIYKNSGIVVSDTPFFSALIDGVEQESRAAGLETVIFTLNRQSSDFQSLLDQLLSETNCGILLLATEMEEADILPFQRALSPIVVLDNWFEDTDLDSVLISNTDSACRAGKYLIRKGHKEIGYLKGNLRIKNFFYREIGLRRAMELAGLELTPDRCFSLAPTITGAHEDMLAALENAASLPTAFFADNDIIALGAVRAMQEKGYRVPEDVSVIGFDDLPYGAISNPALTTVQVPKEEMGRQAVKRLLEVAHGEGGCRTKTQVLGKFVERESVRTIDA